MLKKLCLTIVVLCLSSALFAENAADPTTIVNEKITAFMQQYKIPGMAVTLYIDGKPYAYYFGYANAERKIPITKNSIFEIGSISKVMTSILLAQEIDKAKLQLDDSITKYRSDFPATLEDITLLNLATHTSGLPLNPPTAIQNQAALIQYLKTWTPTTAPDEKWIYSNFGIGLLGDVLEYTTHRDLNQLYRTQILKPLGMQLIGTNVPPNLQHYVVQGYGQDGNTIKPTTTYLFPAAYAVKTSAADMQRFLAAAIGLPGTPESILYPMRMTQAAYVELTNCDQGLGWQIHSLAKNNINRLLQDAMDTNTVSIEDFLAKPTYDGDTLIDKTGSTAGFRAYIALIPNKKTGIVVLANKHVAISEIADTARDILFTLNNIHGDITPQTE